MEKVEDSRDGKAKGCKGDIFKGVCGQGGMMDSWESQLYHKPRG